jgi:hypothetical protein
MPSASIAGKENADHRQAARRAALPALVFAALWLST